MRYDFACMIDAANCIIYVCSKTMNTNRFIVKLCFICVFWTRWIQFYCTV